MKLLFNIFFLLIVIFLIFACSKENNIIENKENNIEINDNQTPESYYSEALIEFENKNYDLALLKFEEVKNQFPLSNEAIQSQIMSAFIEYIKLNYDKSIFKLNKIINRYPSYKNIDYAYYMRALCYYEQIKNETLDGENNTLALENFQQIINRFPNSNYAKDSEQKIIFIKENMAAKHMNIAMFYLNRKKYIAALNRYQNVIDDHSTSKFVPEALHRLVEIYQILGMVDEAKKTAAVLGYNYPNSEWYKYSYDIVEEKKSINNENNKSIIKKLLKPFSIKNEK